jgi:hypothetical protein
MRPAPQLSGRKILPQRHQLPGMLNRSDREKPSFIGFFRMARGLLINRRGSLAA